MNKEEAIKLATIMKAIYPRDFKYEDRGEMLIRATIMKDKLRNYPYEVLYEAFEKITEQKPEWCPSIPEIENVAREIELNILKKRLLKKYNGEPYKFDEQLDAYIVNSDYLVELEKINSGEKRLLETKKTAIVGKLEINKMLEEKRI